MGEIIEPNELPLWFRRRGRSYEFAASDSELAALVRDGLPQRYGPYVIIGADRVKVGRHYSWEPFTSTPDEFANLVSDRGGAWQNLWLWSLRATPELPLPAGVNIDLLCAANGLVLLQRALPDVSPRIAVTYVVEHTQTGEQREYRDYLRIFDAFRRFIRKTMIK